MTQKKFDNSEYNRATLADVAKEMAKPRMTESARRAAVVAPGPEIQAAKRMGIKAIGGVPRSAKQPSERRLDEEALSRMDDEGGPKTPHAEIAGWQD